MNSVLPSARLHVQGAVHALGQLARDGEPQSGARSRRAGAAIEAVEEVRPCLLRDPRPVVGDREAHVAVVARRRDPHVGAARVVADGVVHQHPADLLHALLVADALRRQAVAREHHAAAVAAARPRNSRTSVRAVEVRSSGSCSIETAPESSRERSSRSVASLVSRVTCARIVSRNSSRVVSSMSSDSSSSRNPASEKSGVRSSCEALAMKSLRARSTCARRLCIRSNERARRPSSSAESSPMGWSNWPSATREAAASSRPRRREMATAAVHPTRPATPSARSVAIRNWRSTSEAASFTSAIRWARSTTAGPARLGTR